MKIDKKKHRIYFCLVIMLAFAISSPVAIGLYLDDLEDVIITTPPYGNQLLEYNSTLGNWTNVNYTAIGDGYSGDIGHPHDQDLNTTDNVVFNWVTANSFFGDGGNLTNVTAEINSTLYLPSTIVTTYGTLDSGDITSVSIPEDGDTYNVSEDSGTTPVLRILINFTGLSSFDSVIGRIYYDGGLGHTVQLEIYRNDTSSWENYIEFTDTTDFVNFYVPVFDPENHVNNTNVYLRFEHSDNGVPTHDFYIDYIAIVDGFTPLIASDHDALGGRNNITNHPWAMPTDGSRDFTGDVTFLKNIFLSSDIYKIYLGEDQNAEIGFLPPDLIISVSNVDNIVISTSATRSFVMDTNGIITTRFQSGAKARLTGVQNVNGLVWTKLLLNNEDFDNNDDYDSGIGVNFVVPVNGVYQVSYSVYIQELPDTKILMSGIYINRALAGGFELTQASTGTATDCANSGSDIFHLSATDTIELYVYHDFIGARPFPAVAYSNYLSVQKIG